MILEAKNILYSYKSKRDKIVLKNVSATFEEATFYAIVGSSGSGKTTFLSLLAGLDNPVSGNVLYGGEDIRKKGLNVPEVYAVSKDRLRYLQEDLGDIQLFSLLDKDCGQLLEKTVSYLPEIQIHGAEDLDFSICFPNSEFDKRTIFWDLN